MCWSLIGDHFQKPFEEGAEIVTGSTHKTFFGPQRGVIGVNYKPEDLKWGLWETIETRAFPAASPTITSNAARPADGRV